MGTLYIVATPIGNLADITFRAVEILKEVDVIACEDTRHSSKLFNHYGIKKQLISYYAANEAPGIAKILSFLEEGKDVAYVSDAGTPGISDPGSTLVRRVRKEGFEIVPIPGVSAMAALISVSGVAGRGIMFDGFPSPKKGKRKKRVKELLERDESFIMYESPYRIAKLLEDIKELDSERTVVIGRELTKKFEEIMAGTAAEILDNLSGRSKIQGEFVIIVTEKKYD